MDVRNPIAIGDSKVFRNCGGLPELRFLSG